jgi:uncharacterized membrane protein (Fun14 family)
VPASGYADTLPILNYISEYIFGQAVGITLSLWETIIVQLEMAVPFIIGFIVGIKKI